VPKDPVAAPDRPPNARPKPEAKRRLDAAHPTDEGLRERKKKLTRQLISDVATGMFLKDGFDTVRVIDVAAACGVSEKTVYNYFPTKESLILDRFEDMEADVRRVFNPDLPSSSLVETAVDVIVAELMTMFENWGSLDRPPDPQLIRRFAEMIQESPALRAAQWEMLDKMARVAAEGMARRAGVDPDDPEPQIAANAILGLWRIQFGSMVRHAVDKHSAVEVRDAVIADVRRAGRLIDNGLRLLIVQDNARAPSGKRGRQRVRTQAHR
jgi:AcrR family transcriptional regulator